MKMQHIHLFKPAIFLLQLTVMPYFSLNIIQLSQKANDDSPLHTRIPFALIPSPSSFPLHPLSPVLAFIS